ncbi:MAG TPA: OsmC family protein [Caulobacteraceae bacterium]|nr:OsmC family protein [Caulobacteraceae bacterium]
MDITPRPSTADDSGHGGLQIMIGAGPARFVADEPVANGGLDLGPSPHDIVAAGLAACTSMTLRLYAKRKEWPLGAVHVEVTHARHAGEQPADTFTRRIALGGALDDEQRARLIQIAEMCPIHRLLTAGARIVTEETVAA